MTRLPLRRPPIPAQGCQKNWRKRDVAVLAALRLPDVEHHALAVDVTAAQAQDFGGAQTPAVAGHEQGAVLEVGAGVEDGRHLLGGKNLGECPALLLVRHPLDVPVLVQALAVEEAGSAGGLVESGEADLALGGEVPLIG